VADIVFLLVTVAFFVLCVGYVKLCDRIIGPDPRADAGTSDTGARDAEQPAVAR
jgi:hypothetical protein